MKVKFSYLVVACMLITNPLASFSALAEPVGFNPNAPSPGRLGLPRNKTLGDLGSFESAGGFRINDLETLAKFGYDPSRAWKKGDNIADGLQVGDLDGVFKIKDLTPRQIAELSGTSVNSLPLVGLYGEQSIGDLIKLNPELADVPAESIPAIRDLFLGNYSSAIKSGIVISESYSKDVKDFLNERPELRNLPIKSILQGDFKGTLPVAQATAFRELQARLPEQFKDLPIKSLPALTELSKGNIGGAAQAGLEISVDHFDTLQKFVDKNPDLQNVPIAAIINRDWGTLASSAEKFAFQKLAKTIPPSAQGFAGRSVLLFQSARNGDFNSIYSISGQSIKSFNQFLDRNPHLKDLPLNQILRGDVQAALPKAEQVAIYEISKKIPENYRGLPSQALGALRDLKNGRWENSIEKGVKISAERFKVVQEFYQAHPELEGVSISEVLRGDFGTALNAGEKVALKELAKINPVLGELPLGSIAEGNFKEAFNKGIKFGGTKAINQLLKENPALKDVAVGVLDNPQYSIGSVPGLADTTLGAINGIDGKAISKVPGLNKVPLEFVNANNLSALLRGDLFLNLDLPFGPQEKVARNALSGFTRGKKFTPTPCDANAPKTEDCSHIELTDKKGSSGDGKQVVRGGSQKGKGGWGFLKDVGGGYEKVGLVPWGVSAKNANLKLVINKILETGGFKTTTPSGFWVATESGYAEFGLTFGICIKKKFPPIDTCTSSFIDLPLEYFPEEIIDFKVAERGRVLIATTSPPPRIPRSLINRYRQQYGIGNQYCDIPPDSDSEEGHKDYDEQSELVEFTDGDDYTQRLHPEAYEAFRKLQEAAAKDGVDLQSQIAYRSVEDQQRLWEAAIAEYGSEEEAAKRVAPPGKSEHHTGYVVDFKGSRGGLLDESDPAYPWLQENAEKYGFDLSFPEGNSAGVQFEPWHWRYTGSEEARQALRLDGSTTQVASGTGGSDPQTTAGTGDAAIASVGESAWGNARDRANLLMTSILEASGAQNQVDVAVAIMNRVISSGYPDNATDVTFQENFNPDPRRVQFQPNYQKHPVNSKREAISRLAQYKFGGNFAAAQQEYEQLEQALSNPDNIISAQNHIGGATGFRGFTPETRYIPGDPYRGDPNNPNGLANFFVQESRSVQVATATLNRLGIGSDRFTGISDGLSGGGGGVPCVASSAGSSASGPIVQGDGIATGQLADPLPGSVLTSPYGWRIRPGTNTRKFHRGIDLSTNGQGITGAPVLAADGGRVVYVQRSCVQGDVQCGGQFGNRVEIDHGNGIITAYNHLHNVDVVEGQSVSKGQKIGGEGSTGYSTGVHLDFQVFQGNIYNDVDPAPFLR